MHADFTEFINATKLSGFQAYIIVCLFSVGERFHAHACAALW